MSSSTPLIPLATESAAAAAASQPIQTPFMPSTGPPTTTTTTTSGGKKSAASGFPSMVWTSAAAHQHRPTTGPTPPYSNSQHHQHGRTHHSAATAAGSGGAKPVRIDPPPRQQQQHQQAHAHAADVPPLLPLPPQHQRVNPSHHSNTSNSNSSSSSSGSGSHQAPPNGSSPSARSTASKLAAPIGATTNAFATADKHTDAQEAALGTTQEDASGVHVRIDGMDRRATPAILEAWFAKQQLPVKGCRFAYLQTSPRPVVFVCTAELEGAAAVCQALQDLPAAFAFEEAQGSFEPNIRCSLVYPDRTPTNPHDGFRVKIRFVRRRDAPALGRRELFLDLCTSTSVLVFGASLLAYLENGVLEMTVDTADYQAAIDLKTQLDGRYLHIFGGTLQVMFVDTGPDVTRLARMHELLGQSSSPDEHQTGLPQGEGASVFSWTAAAASDARQPPVTVSHNHIHTNTTSSSTLTSFAKLSSFSSPPAPLVRLCDLPQSLSPPIVLDSPPSPPDNSGTPPVAMDTGAQAHQRGPPEAAPAASPSQPSQKNDLRPNIGTNKRGQHQQQQPQQHQQQQRAKQPQAPRPPKQAAQAKTPASSNRQPQPPNQHQRHLQQQDHSPTESAAAQESIHDGPTIVENLRRAKLLEENAGVVDMLLRAMELTREPHPQSSTETTPGRARASQASSSSINNSKNSPADKIRQLAQLHAAQAVLFDYVGMLSAQQTNLQQQLADDLSSNAQVFGHAFEQLLYASSSSATTTPTRGDKRPASEPVSVDADAPSPPSAKKPRTEAEESGASTATNTSQGVSFQMFEREMSAPFALLHPSLSPSARHNMLLSMYAASLKADDPARPTPAKVPPSPQRFTTATDMTGNIPHLYFVVEDGHPKTPHDTEAKSAASESAPSPPRSQAASESRAQPSAPPAHQQSHKPFVYAPHQPNPSAATSDRQPMSSTGSSEPSASQASSSAQQRPAPHQTGATPPQPPLHSHVSSSIPGKREGAHPTDSAPQATPKMPAARPPSQPAPQRRPAQAPPAPQFPRTSRPDTRPPQPPQPAVPATSNTYYYRILGLHANATTTEIKQQYHSLARRWHPDRNPTDHAAATVMFQRICEAYQVLTAGPRAAPHHDR
ncbi:hypothetical protein CAOG_03745 [Capsaspora owczarzaki ATCC 30864]|uniref:J domain-containing protein n=1 Tax=Capsaspora owczarzaki (strain ATCC 30864) TaxID=595528 RepID=A0A0D2X2N2_CAPO3|nr:hypothetical protein CAOG_03745 [Capsaspora owczarzaki ATCC 30864]KJE92854.1 hypothetical protein CAOG_003745 [Capsaspora owczarzaki ATCC 30864]|eukprot:XP_004363473.1 hypothetical protein CAOG_03745 [Capsaspora owczarzaki ATCC 30864]